MRCVSFVMILTAILDTVCDEDQGINPSSELPSLGSTETVVAALVTFIAGLSRLTRIDRRRDRRPGTRSRRKLKWKLGQWQEMWEQGLNQMEDLKHVSPGSVVMAGRTPSRGCIPSILLPPGILILVSMSCGLEKSCEEKWMKWVTSKPVDIRLHLNDFTRKFVSNARTSCLPCATSFLASL